MQVAIKNSQQIVDLFIPIQPTSPEVEVKRIALKSFIDDLVKTSSFEIDESRAIGDAINYMRSKRLNNRKDSKHIYSRIWLDCINFYNKQKQIV